MRVTDRFADYGLVGLALCSVRGGRQLAPSSAECRVLSVHSFCMSCRLYP